MADIRDWAAFRRSRWDWTRYGYEADFPRGCAFTDIDAATEFDGHSLVIEAKHHDGTGPCPYPPTGQLRYLRQECALGKTVLILYGDAERNEPYAVRQLERGRTGDLFSDWRDIPDAGVRRGLLKLLIDAALGLLGVLEDRS